MSSESSSNKLFWLAHCEAIKDTILPDPGSSNAIFFSTKAYKGPVASGLLPDEYTNYGIYNMPITCWPPTICSSSPPTPILTSGSLRSEFFGSKYSLASLFRHGCANDVCVQVLVLCRPCKFRLTSIT
jgi:hypothetical protein